MYRSSHRTAPAPATFGLDRVTLHQCRHGFDSFLDAAGISEARADRYMGHAQSSVGDRYRHRLLGQLAEDANRLEEYLQGDVAEVVALPTGAHTGARETQAAKRNWLSLQNQCGRAAHGSVGSTPAPLR